MKILKTNQFVFERMKIRPVTNAEFDETREHMKEKCTEIALEKLPDQIKNWLLESGKILEASYTESEKEISDTIEEFCYDKNTRRLKKQRFNAKELFIDYVKEAGGMFYIKHYSNEEKYDEEMLMAVCETEAHTLHTSRPSTTDPDEHAYVYLGVMYSNYNKPFKPKK